MSIADIQASAQARMAKSLEQLKTNLAKIRTGRAHPGILDHVQVEYYGSPVPISQVANVNLMDARTLSGRFGKKTWRALLKRRYGILIWV
jgi:ribosome recycling factor